MTTTPHETTPTDQPEATWTFVGHWQSGKIVVEYVLDGEVQDTRDDVGYWDEGLFAAAASGATQDEALAKVRDEYEAHDDEPAAPPAAPLTPTVTLTPALAAHARRIIAEHDAATAAYTAARDAAGENADVEPDVYYARDDAAVETATAAVELLREALATPTWADAITAATALPVVSGPDALARTNAALTDENDCSMFWVTIAGGSDPVTITATPDEVRRMLGEVETQGTYIRCKECAEHGILNCGETVGACDLCRNPWSDVFVYRPDDVPVETVCLACLCAGKHMRTAHA